MFILISGQSSSGKSRYAEMRLSELSGTPKIYVATSRIYDDEMRERVKKHKAMREGKGFITIECPEGLGGIEILEGSSVLIESLTTWAANEMFTDEGARQSGHVSGIILHDLAGILDRAGNVIVVADDLFSDGVDYDPSTMDYIRLMAELHVRLAELADEVIECVSGCPVHYKRP